MLTTLTGENDFALQAALRQHMADFVQQHTEMAVEQIDGAEADLPHIAEALASPPFLTERKLVVLHRPSSNKQFVEQFESSLTEMPDTTDVLIVEPKLDKRLSYYKWLKKATEFTVFAPLDGSALARWAVDYVAGQDGKLSVANATYLMQRVGTNQQLLAHELDKLVLHGADITRDTIDLLTEAAPQSSIFELLDAAFAGRRQKVLDLYAEQQAQKVEPQQLIAMLAWQLHILALIVTAESRSATEVAAQAKVSPYTVNKSWAAGRGLTRARLQQRLRDLADIDARSKRENLDLHAALQHYLLALSA